MMQGASCAARLLVLEDRVQHKRLHVSRSEAVASEQCRLIDNHQRAVLGILDGAAMRAANQRRIQWDDVHQRPKPSMCIASRLPIANFGAEMAGSINSSAGSYPGLRWISTVRAKSGARRFSVQ